MCSRTKDINSMPWNTLTVCCGDVCSGTKDINSMPWRIYYDIACFRTEQVNSMLCHVACLRTEQVNSILSHYIACFRTEQKVQDEE